MRAESIFTDRSGLSTYSTSLRQEEVRIKERRTADGAK